MRQIEKILLSFCLLCLSLNPTSTEAQTSSNNFSSFIDSENTIHVSHNHDQMIDAKKAALRKCNKLGKGKCMHYLSGKDRFISIVYQVEDNQFKKIINNQTRSSALASSIDHSSNPTGIASRRCERLTNSKGKCHIYLIIDQGARQKFKFYNGTRIRSELIDPENF